MVRFLIGQCLEVTCLLIGQSVELMWLLAGQSVELTWLLIGQSVEVTWLLVGQSVEVMGLLIGQSVDVTSFLIGYHRWEYCHVMPPTVHFATTQVGTLMLGKCWQMQLRSWLNIQRRTDVCRSWKQNFRC